MNFDKSAVAIGVATKSKNVAIFQRLQDKWDSLPESTRRSICELLGLTEPEPLEKSPPK